MLLLYSVNQRESRTVNKILDLYMLQGLAPGPHPTFSWICWKPWQFPKYPISVSLKGFASPSQGMQDDQKSKVSHASCGRTWLYGWLCFDGQKQSQTEAWQFTKLLPTFSKRHRSTNHEVREKSRKVTISIFQQLEERKCLDKVWVPGFFSAAQLDFQYLSMSPLTQKPSLPLLTILLLAHSQHKKGLTDCVIHHEDQRLCLKLSFFAG